MSDEELERIELVPHMEAGVAIFTHWNAKYDEIAKLVLPNWAEYCRKHKYFLRGYKTYHEDPERIETYGDKGKLRLYLDLRGHFRAVMFLDVDSLFMNMEATVEQRLQYSGGRFYYTYDANGPLSGLWIAGTDEQTEKHLRYAYEYAATNNHVRHGKIEPNGISDQDAFTRLMNTPPFWDTFGVHQCHNAKDHGHCYPENYEDGAWLITVPGLPVEEKLNVLREYRDRVRV